MKERNPEDAKSFFIRCQIRTNTSEDDYINQSVVIPLSKEVGLAMYKMFHNENEPQFTQSAIRNEWLCDNQLSNVWLEAVYENMYEDEDTCCGGYTYNTNSATDTEDGKTRDREGCMVWNWNRKKGIRYWKGKK